MLPTKINKKWELLLPEHRAAREDWPYWEKERLAAMHEEIEPGDVVFDIGAEEGDFPALFASWGANIVLIEPNPLVWPNMRVIFEANDLEDSKVGHFVGFASDSTNEKPPQIEDVIAKPDRGNWPECAYGPVIGNHGFRNVSERIHDTPRITIDDFVQSRGIVPNVITIDVEGSELLVLRGADKTLREEKPVVFVSIHPEFMFDHYKQYEVEVHQLMAAYGYVGEHLAFDHEHHYIFRPTK